MKIEFIALDYDYFDFEGKNFVRIWGKTEEGKRVCVIDGYTPYLWAILKDGVSEKKTKEICKEIEKIEIKLPSRTTSVLKTEVQEKKFLSKDVKAIKVFITNHKDAHPVADQIDFPEIEARREYDLSIITKYITDKNVLPLYWYSVDGELLNNSTDFGGIDSVIKTDFVIKSNSISEAKDREFSPKIISFDIETDNFEIGKGNIMMIGLSGKKLRKVFTWKNFHNADYVELCKDEAEMIEKFCECIEKEKPDVLAGYFSDGFDLPYIRARAEKHKVRMPIGLDSSQPTFARGRITSANISGIPHVDLFRFIETAYSQYMQSETLGLNEVALELLGEGKKDFDHKTFKHDGKEGWKEYIEYNLQDALLTYKLAEKIWPDMSEFSKIVQEPLFNVTRDGMSQLVEGYILHNLKKFNEIAEKRPIHDEIEARRNRGKYEGAFVFQPIAGLYENIAIFDFTSMYPSITVTHNLSKSTLTSEKKDAFEVELEDSNVYFLKKQGFFSVMLSEIIEKRKKYKQEYKKNKNALSFARSNAYKLLANASYGYQGFFGARYYCIEAAAATAALGRKFVKEIIDKINAEKFKVIYADTDGIAFLLQDNSRTDTMKMLSRLNSDLPGIMELELEDFYKRGLWVTKRTGDFGAKKKYALLNEKNQMRVRGFETVRRDWCNLAREVQNNVLEKVLKEGNADSSLSYAKKIISDINKRKIKKEGLIIRTQLKKAIEDYVSEGPHVAIAKKMVERGMPVDAGMLIEFYIAEGKKSQLVRERAKMIDEEGDYDIGYYTEHQIIPAIENIFSVFNIEKEELLENKQKKLHEF